MERLPCIHVPIYYAIIVLNYQHEHVVHFDNQADFVVNVLNMGFPKY